MAIIKCKMCGGDMELSPDKTFGTCEYCGSVMTLPKIDDEQRAAQFNRGNHFRRQGEFDKALAVYERIVAEDDTDAEAHWCCALCRFGIEYVEDPGTLEYLPTCHRASFDSFLEDVDYLAALEHSDGLTKRQYQKDGAKIAEVQRAILATSQKEEPFDVFICYKETDDETKERTRDSLDAQEIYYNLTQEGYRVFFARITLEDKAGSEYEPYIFAALNSAKVMVVVGEKAEYFSAVWVKNEWSRFLSLMRKDRTKLLLPCYKNVDPYDLPEQLGVLQSYDMGKIGFMQDLIRGIKKVLRKEEPKEAAKETVVVQQSPGGANLTAQLKRGMQALEDRDWAAADGFFDKALDMDAECAEAFFGKALAAHRVSTGEALVQQRLFAEPAASEAERFTACEKDEGRIRAAVEKYRLPGYLEESQIRDLFSYDKRTYPSMVNAWRERLEEEAPYWEGDRNLSRALRYAKGDFAGRLRQYQAQIEDAIRQKQTESEAEEKQAAEDTAKRYAEAMAKGEKTAEERRKEAEQRRESDYQELCKMQGRANTQDMFETVCNLFSDSKWKGYKDCAERAEQCRAEAEKIRLAAEKAAAAAKKKKATIGVIAAAAVVVIIAAAIVVTQVIIPGNKYKAAETLLAAGDYDGAAASFTAMGDYKNSEELAREAKYQKAQSLFATGDYDSAIDEFSILAGYRDSTEMVSNSKYQKAETLLDSGDYDDAYSLLIELDRKDIIMTSKNDRANALLDSGNYEMAYSLLEEIGKEDVITSSKYERAKGYLDAGDYDNSILLLENLNYLDSKTQLNKAYIAKYGTEKYNLLVDTVKHVEIGDTITFGSYEQDNDRSNGPEGIAWIVLEKQGNDNYSKLYLISKYALDAHAFHSGTYYNGWNNSDIVKWLTTEFDSNIFSAGESRISTISELDLLDKNKVEKYFPSDSDRLCYATAFAIDRGVIPEGADGPCFWWLKGDVHEKNDNFAPSVGPDGSSEQFFERKATAVGVRPVVTITFTFLNPDP